MAEYKEHDKLKKINDKSQAIGEFLEWLEGEENIRLYRGKSKLKEVCDIEDDTLWYVSNKEDLLAKFFDIDLIKLEQEKRDMLDKIRKQNKVTIKVAR